MEEVCQVCQFYVVDENKIMMENNHTCCKSCSEFTKTDEDWIKFDKEPLTNVKEDSNEMDKEPLTNVKEDSNEMYKEPLINVKEDSSQIDKVLKNSKIDRKSLSNNPTLMSLHLNAYKIDWSNMSPNYSTIALLEANNHKIDWSILSKDPAAIIKTKQDLKYGLELGDLVYETRLINEDSCKLHSDTV
jgi:hypothetical protein